MTANVDLIHYVRQGSKLAFLSGRTSGPDLEGLDTQASFRQLGNKEWVLTIINILVHLVMEDFISNVKTIF